MLGIAPFFVRFYGLYGYFEKLYIKVDLFSQIKYKWIKIQNQSVAQLCF